jgi:hypothetical protein
MKKRLLFLIFLVGLPVLAHADQAYVEKEEALSDSQSLEPKRLRDSMFSVSSDELDPAESLNRVSGHIDLGFSAPSQTFQSSDHYSPGPFSREKTVEST